MTEPDKKRRLPIIQITSSGNESETLPRPAWHWSGFGVVVTFLIWLPLSAAATAMVPYLMSSAGPAALISGVLIVGLYLSGFLLATFLGGVFIGKFGQEAGMKEGAVSGFVTAAFAVLITGFATLPTFGIVILLILLGFVGSVGAVSSMVGVKLGKWRR